MSSSDSGPGNREIAYRVFACEYEDATFSYKESDEERAPNYVVSPTGGRLNRIFLTGVLTETAPVGGEQVRARVNDLTGTFVAYAGQYQPDELAFLETAEPPAFLAVTGKARTFTPEDGDRTYSSVRPESISEVDAATRDRWVVRTAEQTVARVGTMASALRSGLTGDALRGALREAGVHEGLADGTALALEYYDPSPAYLAALRDRAIQAVEVVAGSRDEVDRLDVAPDEGGPDPATLDDLATLELDAPEGVEVEVEAEADAETGTGTDAERADEPTPQSATATAGGESGSGPATAETGAEPSTGGGSRSESESASTSSTDSETTVSAPGSTGSGTPEPEPEPAGEPEGATSAEMETGTEVEPPTSEPGGPADRTPAGTAADSESDSGAGSASGSDSAEPDSSEPDADSEDDIGDFEPGEFDLDDEERAEVEEEYGTEFETAAEFDPDGEQVEAESEPAEASATATEAESASTGTGGTSEPESAGSSTADADPEPEPESDPEPATEPETADEGAGTGASADADADADLSLEESVIAVIKELDDGDGAETGSVVATVAERRGIEESEVEAAIQKAMMNGECYEPDDGIVKAI